MTRVLHSPIKTEEKVKATTTGGRKRTHLVKFFLNDDEYEKLSEIDQACNERMENLVPAMAKKESASNLMTKWSGCAV